MYILSSKRQDYDSLAKQVYTSQSWRRVYLRHAKFKVHLCRMEPAGGDLLDSIIERELDDVLQADSQESSAEGLPSFGCSEVFQYLQSCRPEGLVRRGLLRRLLQGDNPFPANFHGSTVQLCGHMFVTSTVFSAGPPTPFLLLRQRLNQLLEGGSGSENLQPLFKQYTEFLHFMECFVHRYVLSVDRTCTDKFQPPVDRVAMEIANQFPPLLSHLDPLEETLSGLSPGGRGHLALTCTNQIAHLVLHTHWTVLSVLYRLVPIIGTTSFLKQAYSTIEALLSYAATKQSQCMSPTERVSLQLVVCPCVLELWLLLLHTLDHLASSNSMSFWILISQILEKVVFPSHDPSHDQSHGLSLDPQESDLMEIEGCVAISTTDPVGFAWWVLTQLALLYRYSKDGQLNRFSRDDGSTDSLPGNWVFVQELLPLTFQQGASETQLRCCLCCLLLLSQRWAPATGPVAKAWDYFQKHLNDSFHLPGGSVQDYITTEGSTPRQWLQYVQSLCAHASEGDRCGIMLPHQEHSSFELFLCILATVLGMGRGQEGQQMWRQLKGRFFSKIHRRWLMDLSSSGLRHLTTLFLTLASVADTTEVGTKMVGNFVNLDLGNPQKSKTGVLWRGVFALLLVFEERKLSMTELIDKLQPVLSQIAKVWRQGSSDQRSLWEIVSMVLDGVQEVLESPEGMDLGATDLIGGYLRELLEGSEAQQLGRIFQFSDAVSSALTAHFQALQREEGLEGKGPVTHSCVQVKERLKAGCQAFWLHCCLPLLSRARDPIPNPQISGSMATITAFACECKELLSQSCSASTFFEEFGANDTASPSLASSYLCHVITNDVIRQQLLGTEHAQLQVAHTWFRCVVLMHNPPACATHVQQLTRLILQLPFVSSLTTASQTAASTDALPVLQQLLRAISSRYSSSPDIRESGLWRERLVSLLGDLPKYIEPALSGNTSGESLKMSYKVVSAVVKICPRLLYSKTDSKCLLPRLVDWLVLPLTSSKKPPVQGMSLCIRTHLQHFLSGLLQLEPSRDDFIRRKVKQIFSKYFHSYAQPKNPLMMQNIPNPFMVLLQPCFALQVSEETSQQLLLILEVIAAQFLVLPQQPPSLLPTLQFLRQTVEKVQNQKLLVKCTPSILGNMLSCLLACDVCSPQSEPQGIRRQVMGILRPLLQACDRNQDTLPHTSLLPILRDFIVSNLEQCQAAVFKSLVAVAELYALLVRGILPTALQAVERYETSRGVGTDSRLRSAYHDVILAAKVKE